MRKKRISYNELNEEIYESKYWTRTKLIFLGIIILFIGFLINFSLEEKLNKNLSKILLANPDCPISFEKIELTYFAPKIIMKKINISGQCFGQPANRLNLDELKIYPDIPSITHFGLRIGLDLKGEDSNLHLSPIISPFGIFIEIEPSNLNAKFLHVFTSDDKSPVAGKIALNGFLKFESGILADGELQMESKNFHFPSQRISGFELSLIPLDKFNLHAKFEKPGEMEIKNLELGKPGKQIEIKLKGKLFVSKSSFATSLLTLKGSMNLSKTFLNNYSFLTFMLPQGHPDGKFQMSINGPIFNPGPPQFQ